MPSPDWFVGVSNVSLCAGGDWVEELRLAGTVYDAGTDNGLTFTAPNWETQPRNDILKRFYKFLLRIRSNILASF